MNTKNLLTKTALCMLCLGVAVPSFAQGKNLLKGAKKIFETPRITRGTTQRFVFPTKASANIRAAISAGKLDRAVLNAATQTPQVPFSLDASPDTQLLFNKSLVAQKSLEKEILTIHAKEGAFYAPEIDAGRAIRQQILDITVLSDEGQQALAENIRAYIKNHTLQVLLLEELENYDIYNMALDLTDYFCLDKPFEKAAFDYTLRHPHQMNLNMRRLMYNPLVDDSIKNRLKYFLEKEFIPVEEYPALRAAIRTAHMQYRQRLAAAQEADVIQAQIAYYQDVTNRLSDFVVKANPSRRPKWNTRSAKERALAEEIEWIRTHDEVNKFPQIMPWRQALEEAYRQAPTPTVLPFDETVKLYEQFVQTTHRRYPRTLQDKLKKGEISFEQEETLWDSLDYWRTKDEAAIHPKLVEILNKYDAQ